MTVQQKLRFSEVDEESRRRLTSSPSLLRKRKRIEIKYGLPGPRPKERAMVRTINYTFSVIEVWRRLIVAADFKVLHSERAALRRREKYLEADRLFLKWPQEGEKRDGPAYSIVKIYESPIIEIIESLSLELKLEMNSLYTRFATYEGARLNGHIGAVFENDYQTAVASTDKKEKNRLYRQISSTIDTCKKLQLDANREAYFK
ncbi:hypothetical protein P885DRAFT_62783 [Corynascus similis CBS 632.67]